MNGKEKCRILKQIRAQIARENGIALAVEECTHKGECRGTCPRCEAEVLYLERELDARRRLHRKVALAGIAAGVTAALSGCSAIDAARDAVRDAVRSLAAPTAQVEVLEGEVAPLPTQGVLLPEDMQIGPTEGPVEFITEGLVPAYDMARPQEGGQ